MTQNPSVTADDATAQGFSQEDDEPALPEVAAGRTVGDFVLLEKIGEGGAGLVFKAYQTTLARNAVVKILRTHASDERAHDRFLREARFASTLDHPYAAHVYAFGVEDDGLMWLAMELVSGLSLRDLIEQRGTIPLRRFIPLFERICEVVHTAHQYGIIHRDIKPANVMVVTRAGRLLPKLLDFGIAKVIAAVQSPDSDTPTEGQAEAPLPSTQPENLAAEASVGFAQPVARSSHERSSHERSSHEVSSHEVSSHERSGQGTLSDTGERSSPGGSTDVGAVSGPARGWTGMLSHTGSRKGTVGSNTMTHGKISLDESDVLSSLTMQGTIVGSPSFMAPEQWVNNAKVDERTDVYALGILAYNALVGKVPFRRRTTRELREAHLKKRPPKLDPRFPRALDAVFQRALAKDQADRYATPIELARAMRSASGLAEDESEQVPRLDRELVDRLVRHAPAPLAECVALLDTTRNFDHTVNAMLTVVRTATRWVGVLAVAGRTGSAHELQGRSRNLLASLRERELAPPEWVELAELLCVPWFEKPNEHPLPELVSVCRPPSTESPSLTDEVRSLWDALNDATVEASARVQAALPGVEQLIDKLCFSTTYQLIVPAEAGLEVWMGLSGPRRPLFEVDQGDDIGRGPFLASADGQPLVSLWPLAEAAAPLQGAPPALFLLAGPGRYSARLSAEPSGYVRESDHVWPFLAELLGEEAAADTDEASKASPYRGLSAFTAEDKAFFYGRERETEASVNRLKRLAMLAIVGPSGSGKSSFVFAGILPSYGDDYRVAQLRPGRKPLEAIAAALSGVLDGDIGLTAAQIALAPEGAGEVVLAAARKQRETLIIVIDQFEELFTLGADAATQAAFAAFLAALSVNADDPIRIIITLRDDFLIRAEQLAALRGRIAYGLQLLTTPQREDLMRILVEPARRLGYRFDDDTLPEEMVADVEGRPGALALLSFTAAQVWEQRDKAFRRLLRRTYAELGGVGGALAQHAERTLASFDAAGRAMTRAIFRHLVTAEGTRAILTRDEVRQLLGEGRELVLERLLESRLLSASEGEEGVGDRVEVSHEALLSAWPRLVAWRQEDSEGARLRDQLRVAAKQWHERGRLKSLLWRGEALIEYRIWRGRHSQPLTEVEEAFASASEAEARRTKRIRQSLLGGTLLGVSVFAAVITWQRGVALEQKEVATQAKAEAQQAAEQARARLAEMQLESGRLDMLADSPLRALPYLAEARRNGARGAGLDFLTRRALDAIEHRVGSYSSHEGKVWYVLTTADWLVTAGDDGAVRARRKDGTREHVFQNEARVLRVDIDPSGRYLVAGSGNVARVWNLSDGSVAAELQAGAEVWQVAFSPLGDRIIVAGEPEATSLWSFPEARRLADVSYPSVVLNAEFSPDGKAFVTGGWDGPMLWSSDDGKLLHKFHSEERRTTLRAAFSPQSDRLVTSEHGGPARVWSTQTGQLIATLDEGAPSFNVVFSPNGETLAITRATGVTHLYDSNTYKLLATLSRHDGTVTGVKFTPDGKRLVTTGPDGLIRLWDAVTGTPIATMGGHQGHIDALAISDEGRVAITGGSDGHVFAWDLQKNEAAQQWPAHEGRIWQLSYSADGSRLISAAEDGRVRILDTTDGRVVHEMRMHSQTPYAAAGYTPPIFAAFHPDGRQVAIAQLDTLQVHDIEHDELLRTVQTPGNEIYIAAWDHSGERLTYGGQDGKVYVLGADGQQRQMHVADAHKDLIWGLAFSPDDTKILSISEDKTAKLWDAASGSQLREFRGHVAPLVRGSFDPSGQRVVTTSQDKTARIWRLDGDHAPLVLEGHRGGLMDAVFSPDGELVSTVGSGGEMIVWEARTGVLLRRYRADSTGITIGVAFDPQRPRLATGGADGVVRIWDVAMAPIAPDLEARIRCHVPYRLMGERVSPHPLELQGCDPT